MNRVLSGFLLLSAVACGQVTNSQVQSSAYPAPLSTWIKYTSREGKFSFSLPVQPEVRHETHPSGAGDITTTTYFAKDSLGFAFSASFLDVPQDAFNHASLYQIYKNAEKNFVIDLKIEEGPFYDHTFLGRPSMKLEHSDGYAEFVLVGHRMYIISGTVVNTSHAEMDFLFNSVSVQN